VEHNNIVDNGALQKQIDEAEVQICNHNERLKKLEEKKNEYAKKTDEMRIM
jgi:flagellar motility protein MotE (MotC chaperone)